MAGVATTLVAVVVATGLGLAILQPASPSDQLENGPTSGSYLDPFVRLQRAGEIGAGRATVSAPGLPAHVLDLTDHRKGEIGAGAAGADDGNGFDLTDHRRGEINGGN
ncbi:MAG: hypothetical protein L0227_13775 [Chloroflexi bacterium]|nr:hypothetical protein [Chloroflexota bacterium]